MVVQVERNGAAVAIEIRDDGVGGVDPSRGTGVRGLADRIEALGGSLVVSSAPGVGHDHPRRGAAAARMTRWCG